MCGIVGIVDLNGAPVGPERVRPGTDLLHRRGPDDEGQWGEGPVALGHRRLSILDVSSAGHQPMFSADDRYVLVFNGEIYNFRALRNQLPPPQGGWRSEGDSEVVLAAYARWGPQCVSHFNGMFALAIWDRHERTLFAARDRMGIKPLYYHHTAGCTAFASRPRALFAVVPDLSHEIDFQGMRLYLETGYYPAPHAFNASIRKLPQGHYMLVRDGELNIERYWDFDHIATNPDWRMRDEAALLDELEGRVTAAVERRMVSDVPLGAFLSGGIDSSIVVAAMTRLNSSPVKTFTIGFGEGDYDESPRAAAIAEHLGTDHTSLRLGSDDLLDLMPLFGEEYDEPFFDSSAFPVMAVSRLAREHVTVSLSGDGGDELFGGYHYYPIVQKLALAYGFPRALRVLASFAFSCVPRHDIKLLARALDQRDVLEAFAFSRSVSKDFGCPMTREHLAATYGIQELFAHHSADFAEGLSAAEQAMRLDANLTLPDEYLQKVDVASMAFSLEARVPLLDHELVEWAMQLPQNWKMRDGSGKYLLKQLALRSIPREIVMGPKRGFTVPIAEWLRGPLKGWAEDMLATHTHFETLGLDREHVQRLWAMHLDESRNVHPLLWSVLMLLNYAERARAA